MSEVLLLLATFGPVSPAGPADQVAPVTTRAVVEGPPVIPPGGNAWATVVRNRDGRRVDVIDRMKKPGDIAPERVAGRSYLYLNRGIPEVLPLSAETLAGLTEHDDERVALSREEDARDDRTRLIAAPGPWTVAVTGAAKLNGPAADRLNTVTPRPDGEPRTWAAGDYAVRVVPSAPVRMAAFSLDPAAPKTEREGRGMVAGVVRRPEVWRHRAGEWTLIDPGLMDLNPYFIDR